MKNKKASHVGIVLSFIIFVTFLVFLYTILEPSLNVERDKEALLEHLKTDLLEMFEEELIIVTIKIDDSVDIGGDCVQFNNMGSQTSGKNLIVKGKDDVALKYKWQGEVNLLTEFNTERFFKIFYSEEFEEEDDSFAHCTPISPNDYSGTFVSESKYIFKTKVDKLVLNYTNDLKILRTELKIPEDSGFGFRLLDKERIVLNQTNEGNVSLSIFSDEIPVQYVNETASIEPGFVVVRVW